MNQLNEITLPPDLLWTDEFSWQPVGQQVEYSLTGALGIEESAKQAGRPMTLTGAAQRPIITALYALTTKAGTDLTLTFNDIDYSVRFRHTDTALEAEGFYPLADPDDTFYYNFTLRLMQV